MGQNHGVTVGTAGITASAKRSASEASAQMAAIMPIAARTVIASRVFHAITGLALTAEKGQPAGIIIPVTQDWLVVPLIGQFSDPSA